MSLMALPLSEYFELLASAAPAPGGGSASALCGAQGAALVEMAARLTLGRKKYEAEQALSEAAAREAGALREKLCALIERDAEAYRAVFAAYGLPKDTEEERAARGRRIAEETLRAAEAPLETMRLAVEGLRLARRLAGHSNANAASDLGVAALNLLASVRGAWLNVRANLDGIADPAKAEALRAEGEALLRDAETLAAA